MKEEDIKRRRQKYFGNLLNTENKYEELNEAFPMEGPMTKISRSKLERQTRQEESWK